MALFGKKTENNLALPEKLPEHVAFIMDGNGRWAKKRGLPRQFGHREGAKNFRTIVRHCKDIGLKCISFYAFSTENWQRPKEEVDALMVLFSKYLDDVKELLDENTRMVFLGDKSGFTEELRRKMEQVELDTSDKEEMTILMAVNYGGKAAKGDVRPEDINEDSISANLYTTGYPDVDLLIRPSGEQRLSNFLIWQCAYAEYYFTDVLWPDFNNDELDKAIIEFGRRQRRFGGV
jgi:undecaprenyl diphosphate synthase